MANGLSLNIDTTKSEFQNPMVELRQGDGNYQSLSVTVTSNGEPFDLTGWTITFMGTTAGGFKIVDTDSAVKNALQGQFTYTPPKSWGQDVGMFKEAYFKFTSGANGNSVASGASLRVNVLTAVDLTDEEAGDYISVVDVMIDKIKTDMDNKLKDTQVTLNATQDQAHSVQNNVDALNTNVNTLKAQNNNIKTTDNTWTGTNTFNKKIIAPDGVQGKADTADFLNIRSATFNDISVVTEDMFKYAGDWALFGYGTTGMPDIGFCIMEVLPYPDNKTAGVLRLSATSISPKSYIGMVKDGQISWMKLAYDSTLVHNSGNETVAGDKTFTGFSTFTQPINGALKTRHATFTDFSDVAKNMQVYAGNWIVDNTVILNAPQEVGVSYIVTVITGTWGGNGVIYIYDYTSERFFYTSIDSAIKGWIKVSRDDLLVHNTGNETVAGDKTFTGSLTINDANPLKVKQSATVEFDSWQSSKMKATRFGNIVSLRYSVNPNNNNTITKNQTSSVVIPQGYRPMENWNMAVGGVSAGSNVLVNPDGTLTSGWQDVEYAGMMTAMYFTADPFPS